MIKNKEMLRVEKFLKYYCISYKFKLDIIGDGKYKITFD